RGSVAAVANQAVSGPRGRPLTIRRIIEGATSLWALVTGSMRNGRPDPPIAVARGRAPRFLCTVHSSLCTAIQPIGMSSFFPARPLRVRGAHAQVQGAPRAGAIGDPTGARGQRSEKSIVRASDARAPPALAHDLLSVPHQSRVGGFQRPVDNPTGGRF